MDTRTSVAQISQQLGTQPTLSDNKDAPEKSVPSNIKLLDQLRELIIKHETNSKIQTEIESALKTVINEVSRDEQFQALVAQFPSDKITFKP